MPASNPIGFIDCHCVNICKLCARISLHAHCNQRRFRFQVKTLIYLCFFESICAKAACAFTIGANIDLNFPLEQNRTFQIIQMVCSQLGVSVKKYFGSIVKNFYTRRPKKEWGNCWYATCACPWICFGNEENAFLNVFVVLDFTANAGNTIKTPNSMPVTILFIAPSKKMKSLRLHGCH